MIRRWNFCFALAVFTATFFNFSFAHAEKYTVGEDRFTVNVPKGWTVSKDFFGFPVVMVGPDNAEGQRTVVGITPVGMNDTDRVFEKSDKDVSVYVEGRKKWLANYSGKADSFDPYEKTSWKGIEEAHTLGYHYELPNGKFYERSVFALCNGRRVYHVKTLVYSKYENTDNAIVDQTLKSIQCEKTEIKSASL
jgi:hypothetical protein